MPYTQSYFLFSFLDFIYPSNSNFSKNIIIKYSDQTVPLQDFPNSLLATMGTTQTRNHTVTLNVSCAYISNQNVHITVCVLHVWSISPSLTACWWGYSFYKKRQTFHRVAEKAYKR